MNKFMAQIIALNQSLRVSVRFTQQLWISDSIYLLPINQNNWTKTLLQKKKPQINRQWQFSNYIINPDKKMKNMKLILMLDINNGSQLRQLTSTK